MAINIAKQTGAIDLTKKSSTNTTSLKPETTMAIAPITNQPPSEPINTRIKTGVEGVVEPIIGQVLSGIKNIKEKGFKGILQNLSTSIKKTTGQDLSEAEINQVIARRKELIKSGTPAKNATKLAVGEIQKQKTQSTALGFVGGEGEIKAGEEAVAKAEQVAKEVPKELQPLAEEAKKYKSAEEFVGYTSDNGQRFLGLTKESGKTSSPWRWAYEKDGKEYAGHSTSQEKAIQEIKSRFTNAPANESPRQIRERLGLESASLSRDKMMTILNEGYGKDIEKLSKMSEPQLTDLYNQATKEVPKPEVPIEPKPVEVAPSTKGPELPADEMSQQKAYAQSVEGDLKKSGLKGFATDLKNRYVDWINARKAARDIEGVAAAKPFVKYDAEGADAIQKIQSGDQAYSDVRNYFDNKLNEVNKAGESVGVEVNKKINYLPQLWNNTEAEINRAYSGRQITTKPSFAMDSIIRDYKTGIENGLAPKFTKVSDLVAWYERTANKFIADTKFMKYLTDNGFIQPGSLAPREWKSFNPDHFPLNKATYAGKEYAGVFKGPPNLVDVVNGYLEDPNPTLQRAADVMGTLKNTALSIGVPGTGINVHEFNVFPRSFFSSFAIGDSPTKIADRIANSVKYIFNPNAASKYISDNIELAAEFAKKSDFMISTEEHALDPATTGFGEGKIGETIGTAKQKLFNTFGRNEFQKIIPALKTQWMADTVDKFVANGLTRDAAIKEAGPIVNNFFGGVNWEAMGRSKNFQNVLRAFVFAPDFAETALNLGKGMFMKGESGALYRKFAGSFLTGYTALNILNYRNTGKFMWENDTLHQFSVAVGKDAKGKTIYWNPFGTGFDFMRIPLEAATAIGRGEGRNFISILRNRLSVGAGSAVSLLSNTDWAGRSILGPDKYNRPQSLQTQLGNVFNNTIGNVFPSSIQDVIGGIGGTLSPEQAIIQGLGLPFSFVKPYTPKKKAIGGGAITL